MRAFAGLVAMAATVSALVVTAGPAAASCAEPSIDLLDGADVAFAGVVTERREAAGDLIVTVRVDRVFAGDVRRRVDVVSQAESSDYAITAVDGDRLVVFGTLDDEEVTSSLCRTVVAPGDSYRQVLADLGEGTAPPPGHLRADRGLFSLTYDQFRTGRGVFGALALGLMVVFAVRAWRARRRTR